MRVFAEAFLIRVNHPGVDADDCAVLGMILASPGNKIVSPVQLKDITPDDVDWGGRKSACLKGLLQKARESWQSRLGKAHCSLCDARRFASARSSLRPMKNRRMRAARRVPTVSLRCVVVGFM